MSLRSGFLFFCAVLGGFAPAAFPACSESNLIREGFQSSGAPYSIWMPETSCWNGNFIVFAHGYVAPNRALGVPQEQLTVDGVSLPALANELGYGFAASGYRKNGLAIREGLEDTTDLVRNIIKPDLRPDRIYLVGASEGGLITTLSAEQFPHLYNSTGAACGPIGSFQAQINYLGDFRVVFDYFFPGLVPGAPTTIPQEVIENWDTVYAPAISAALAAEPEKTAQVINVMQAPVTSDPATVESTILQVLWYNVFAVNDATLTLGGQSFDNHDRIYKGSDDDVLLNLGVQRFTADPEARAQMKAHYETTGKVMTPLVTIHTTVDPVVPYWHETKYTPKTIRAGAFFERTNLSISAYGHCTFTSPEVLAAVVLMVLRDVGQDLFPQILTALPERHRSDFVQGMRNLGLHR